jgi:membrane protein
MHKTAILFDIDGTLVDSNDFHVLAWDEAFREAGYSFPADALHRQIGKGADLYVPALLPELPPSDRDKLGEAHGRIYKSKYLERVKPFAGARELLVRTHDSGRKVVLASSASGDELEHYVDLLKAGDLLAASTSKDDVAHSKPCPDIFATACSKAGAAPEAALVIGDTPYDIEAASRSGIEAIAVRSGKFADEDLRGAIAIYDDVQALLEDFDQSAIAG